MARQLNLPYKTISVNKLQTIPTENKIIIALWVEGRKKEQIFSFKYDDDEVTRCNQTCSQSCIFSGKQLSQSWEYLTRVTVQLKLTNIVVEVFSRFFFEEEKTLTNSFTFKGKCTGLLK